jgi:hypothetical protein
MNRKIVFLIIIFIIACLIIANLDQELLMTLNIKAKKIFVNIYRYVDILRHKRVDHTNIISLQRYYRNLY